MKRNVFAKAEKSGTIHVRTLYVVSGHILEFLPVVGFAGYSHRVVLNEVSVDWLGDHERPCKRTAEYFLRKHKIIK